MGTARILTLIGMITVLAGCNAGKSTPSASAPALTGTTAVVAVINGTNITDAELTDAARDELKQFDMQIYKAKKGALDELIEKKLIEDAAKKASKSVDEYIKLNITDKVKTPSEDEIKAFYDSHKDQVGGKSFDEVKASIAQFMNRRVAQDAHDNLIAQLKKDAKVEIKLEPPRVVVETGDNPSKGPKNAPIVIVEFTDYQCPFCGRVRPTINQILEKYKDKVHYVLRDYPLPFHNNAKKAAEAAHCAGDQGKYWELNTILFKNQSTLDVEKLKGYAKEVGLNQAKFDKCLDSGKYTKKVDENQAYGSKMGVNGTPAYFINGVMLSGAQPLSAFTEIIDVELENKK